ncbi:hypothetical protein M569_15889, partial [Genlisea aurea]
RSWLLGTISEDSFQLIIGCETARSLWTAFENAYAQKSEERRFSLRYQLAHFRKKADQSLDDFLMKFKSLCDSLAAI